MPLEIHDVAIAAFGLRAKEMIEGDFVERGGRSESRNMPADAFLNLVGAHHHGQRVPADQALDAALHLLAAGKRRLLPRRNRILVRRGRRERQVDAGLAPRVQRQLLQQSAGAVGTAAWKVHNPGNRPTPWFPKLLSRQFPSEPRLVSPS